ncbi:glycosyl transferase [Halobacteriales archaeon QS_8_69_73]|nr:MAG: glycosyl transferase [Halobacteriales archaeon QS_8_69_73]
MTAARRSRSLPVSVVLPTTDGVGACREVAALLAPDDELLVVCDTGADPIVDAELPAAASVVVAGEPEGCSGKANAVAAGLEAAAHDRFVLTDDDFARPPSWLDRLRADYERLGPVSELPLFVGRDPLSRLLEPLYAWGTLGLSRSDTPWGGALIFDRADVDGPVVRRRLRRTVSDDGLLSEHLEVTQRPRLRRVPVGGSLRTSLERHVRFVQIFRRFAPWGLAKAVAVLALLTAVCLVAPVVGVALVTALTAAAYATLGVGRPAVLWSAASVVAFLPLLCYALARRTFVWGGRRYRWRGRFDVEVEGRVDR